MGWLLLRKKKSAARSKGTSPAPATASKSIEARWDPHRTLQGLKALALTCALVLAVWGWRAGDRALREHFAKHRATIIPPESIELMDAPSWMHATVERDLQRLVADQLRFDPLLTEGLNDAVEALKASAWVRHVDRVERQPDRVRVWAVYRHPVAAIAEVTRRGTVYHWVDGRGVRLPVTANSLRELDPALPLVLGVQSVPAKVGGVWEGEDLQAGLALVRELQGQKLLKQVRALDVGARDGRGRVHLFLATDRREPVAWGRLPGSGDVRKAMREKLRELSRTGVIWGLPPGQEQSVDLDADHKLIRLVSVQDRYDSIDARGKVVDISGGAAMVLQPSFE
jgi:hypothetical protein